MQTMFDKLKENLVIIYRKGLDADKKLDEVQQQGKGKFQFIFTTDSGFQTQSKRFAPYIEELATDVMQLELASQQKVEADLPMVVKKMEMLFATLGQLQGSLKG